MAGFAPRAGGMYSFSPREMFLKKPGDEKNLSDTPMSAVKNEEIMFCIVFFGSGETGMNRVSSHHNHENRTDGSRLPDF